jgi:hypothetical protein
MRFVGGKLSKNDGGVTVNTPQGALAIRGGMFMGQITGPKSAIYSFLYGVSLTLAGKGTIFEPNNSFYVTPQGSTISPTTQAAINAMMAALTRVGGYNNAGTNPPTTPSPGQLTIETNNYSETINEATVQQIQAQIAKQIADLNNTPTETPTTPTTPPDTGDNNPPPPPPPPPPTLLTGYAGGVFTTTGGNPDDQIQQGTLTNFSPNEVAALFDSQTGAFKGAEFTLYVNNGQTGAGGGKFTFAPVAALPQDVIQNLPPDDQAALQQGLQDIGGFLGLADYSQAPSSVQIFDNTQPDESGAPQLMGDPQTLTSGAAGIVGFTKLGDALCTNCDFLTWGIWASAFQSQDGTYNPLTTATGFWVAGDVIQDTIGALPVTGTATYDGTAWGSVWNNRNEEGPPLTYVANGEMEMSWNFGTRAGRFDVTGFDSKNIENGGLNFGGALSAPGVIDGQVVPTNAPNTFSGALAPTGEWCQIPSDLRNLTGNVIGSFVSATKLADGVTAGLPKGVIGNWTIGNNVYKASGIFAGSPASTNIAIDTHGN